MRQKQFERLGLQITEIVMKNGKIYKNYPLRGDNLCDAVTIRNHLKKHGFYHITLGNNRQMLIIRTDVEQIR